MNVTRSVSRSPRLAVGLAAPAAAQQTIKIGELNSYKAFPAFLDPYKKGMEMAVEEINAKGGVLGKKLEVISRDDGANPGEAVRVAEELVTREGVAMLAGTFLSNIGLAVTNFAGQKKVFFLAAEPLTDKITWAGRQQIHLPPARLDLHAGGHADAGDGRREEEALGAGLSQFRIRPVGRRRVQGSARRKAARRRIRHRAGDRRSARSTPARWRRRSTTPSPTASSTCCSAAISPSSCARATPAACSRTAPW